MRGALIAVYRALGSLPLAAATVVHTSIPPFTPCLAWPLLGERLNGRCGWLAAALGGWGWCCLADPASWAPASPATKRGCRCCAAIGLAGAPCSPPLLTWSVRALGRSEHPLVTVLFPPGGLAAEPAGAPGSIRCCPRRGWALGCWRGLFTHWALSFALNPRGLMALAARPPPRRELTCRCRLAALWGVLWFGELVVQHLEVGRFCVDGHVAFSCARPRTA